MQHRWSIPVTAFLLVGGSMVAATGAASASTGAPRPGHDIGQSGGPAGHLIRSVTLPGGLGAFTIPKNWSGYLASEAVSTISANWTEPTGVCSSGDQYSSFWVGLGDEGRQVRIGSEVDCAGNQAQYYAWYTTETCSPTTAIFSNVVEPGDHLSGSVTYDGFEGTYFVLSLTLSDTTQGWTQSPTLLTECGPIDSAEAIVQAPNVGGVRSLADFGTVRFTDVTVDGSAIGSASPAKIIMKHGGTKLDKIGKLFRGKAFTATWLASS